MQSVHGDHLSEKFEMTTAGVRQGGADKDVLTRIGKARATFHMFKNIWKSRELTIKTKLVVFNSNARENSLAVWLWDLANNKEEPTEDRDLCQ